MVHMYINCSNSVQELVSSHVKEDEAVNVQELVSRLHILSSENEVFSFFFILKNLTL